MTLPPSGVRTPGSSRRRVGEQGASAVEFALVLPVLVMIVGAIIDFGFIFSQQITFNTAARDAARSAVTKDFSGTRLTCAQVATRARNGAAASAGAVGANATQVAVTVTGNGGSCALAAGATTPSGASVYPCAGSAGPTPTPTSTSTTVTITYASSPPFPVPFMGTVNLTARGDFQCEYT